MKVIFAALLAGSCLSCLAAEPCKPNPYRIQTGSTGLAGQITLPPLLAGGAAKPSANTAQAAVEFSRSMYAAMAPSVVREMLEVYTCLVEKAVDDDSTKTVEQRADIKDAWKSAKNDIINTLAGYVVILMTSPKDFGSLNPSTLPHLTLNAEERSPAPYLGVLKDENFTVGEAYQVYIGATINGITGTACGSYLRMALASNAGNIQHFAGAVRPIMLEYFDASKNSVRNAKSSLYAESSTIVQAVAPAETAARTSLSQCSALRQ